MAKLMELNTKDVDLLSRVGKALSSPVRIEIINLLNRYSLNVAEIAEKLDIPVSSAAVHIRVLEEAELVNSEIQPGKRGSMKLCSRKNDIVNILLFEVPDVNEVSSVNMPIGMFTDSKTAVTCGIATADDYISREDSLLPFYLPERVDAQIIWSSSGYLEYKFPNEAYSRSKRPKQLTLSAEICSEAPNYREDWKSDITLWVNSVKTATWQSPGDLGARRGRLNPEWWANGNSQHGLLTTWTISETGTSINGRNATDVTLDSISFDEPFITIRIGNADDAQHRGGFNIFGSRFGDHSQDIILTLEY